MRISTLHIYNIANVGMSEAQQAIVKTEEQIATGKRVVNPADDPIASTVALQVKEVIARSGQFQKNIDVAENLLELEEVALKGVMNLIQRIRELTVQAGNSATLTESDYTAIAAEVDSRLDELLDLTNTQSAGGEYIFSGYQGKQQAYVEDASGNYQYQGDEGSLAIKISSIAKVQVSDSGKRLFENIQSSTNSIRTSVNSANQSTPPISISVGQVVDQEAFDDFYPEDMVVTFNAISNVAPPGSNYTITERSSGRVISANQPYNTGDTIVANGVSFRIDGEPYAGTAATTASLAFGSDAVQNFAGDETGETITLRVGGITETLTITANLTNDVDLVNDLSTGANAALLANLGVTINSGLSPPEFEVASGLNLSIDPNSSSGPNILAALGLNSGTASSNGQPAVAGDQVYVESSKTQGLLTSLRRFSEALHQVDDDNPSSKDLVDEVVALTLSTIKYTESTVNAAQSEIGARLNTIESTRNFHLDSDVLNKEVLSDLEDLDYAEAATRLSLESFILQATQQSFVRVSSLSLFSLL